MKYSLTVVLLAFVVVTLYGIEPEPGQPSLNQQFQAVREQAEVIESFRMVKAYQVENFWKSVQDTLRQKDGALLNLKSSLAKQETEISMLKNTMQQKEKAVADKEFDGTHISVMGWDVSKTGFVKAVATTTTLLLVIIVLSAWAFKISYKTARESRSLYDEVCSEFDNYKHKMVEKEVKLLRELQDHRNLLSELKSA